MLFTLYKFSLSLAHFFVLWPDSIKKCAHAHVHCMGVKRLKISLKKEKKKKSIKSIHWMHHFWSRTHTHPKKIPQLSELTWYLFIIFFPQLFFSCFHFHRAMWSIVYCMHMDQRSKTENNMQFIIKFTLRW